MAVQLQRIREFVPDAGNKGRDESEKPITVFLRSVNVYTKQNHISKFIGKTGQELMKDMMSETGSKEIKKILDECVVRFENLEVTDEPSKEEVALAAQENRPPKQPSPRPALMKDIWELGEWQLCLEIFTNILNSSQLTKDEVKNSNSQSGSLQTPEVAVH